MSEDHRPIKVLLDEGVPDSVGSAFSAIGCTAIFHREVLSSGASDDLLCKTALLNGAILIAQDKDMKQSAKRFGTAATNDQLARLNLIRLCCPETLASKRVAHLMSLIQHEWKFTCEKVARRMWIDIGAHFFKSHR